MNEQGTPVIIQAQAGNTQKMKAESGHLEIWQEVRGFRQRYRSENKFCQVWKSHKHARITLHASEYLRVFT